MIDKKDCSLHCPSYFYGNGRDVTMAQILVLICLYCLKWSKFDKLFLREVITIDATRCLAFSSKCMKMRLAAGLRLDTLGELICSVCD